MGFQCRSARVSASPWPSPTTTRTPCCAEPTARCTRASTRSGRWPGRGDEEGNGDREDDDRGADQAVPRDPHPEVTADSYEEQHGREEDGDADVSVGGLRGLGTFVRELFGVRVELLGL